MRFWRPLRRAATPFRSAGSVPKWPNGADCKSAGSAFTGSNPVAPIPPPATPRKRLHGPEKIRFFSRTGVLRFCRLRAVSAGFCVGFCAASFMRIFLTTAALTTSDCGSDYDNPPKLGCRFVDLLRNGPMPWSHSSLGLRAWSASVGVVESAQIWQRMCGRMERDGSKDNARLAHESGVIGRADCRPHSKMVSFISVRRGTDYYVPRTDNSLSW